MGKPIEALKAKAARTVADNALALAGLTPTLRPMAVEERAGRWWDLPAKYDYAKQVYGEELRKWPGHNDASDAMRHAEASRRIAENAGQFAAEAAGFGHEMANWRRTLLTHGSPGGPYERSEIPPPGQNLDEMNMDLRNNAEGRRAARERRPVDPRNLQERLITPSYSPVYRAPQAGVEGLPRR